MDIISIGIDTAVFVAMLVFLIFGIILGLNPLWSCKRAFGKAAESIRSNVEYRKKLRDEVLNKDDGPDLFEDSFLQKEFACYRENLIACADKEEVHRYEAIEEYFNEPFLDAVAHSRFCDLIPGTLTGLGLLGTFLGLTVGITGFDFTSSTGIETSIQGLLSGMNTAFITSIVGVIASILFASAHKRFYEMASDNVSEFVKVYNRYILPNSESQPLNQLLEYQRKQTEFMQNFSGEVSAAVSASMEQLLLPVFDRMEETIQRFGEFASAQQQEGMQKIVNEFIRAMNESLNGQFEELGQTIHALCDWQKESMESMKKIVEDICETSTDIEQINAASQKTIDEIGNFVERLNELQQSINKEVEENKEVSAKQNEYIAQLVAYEAKIADLADNVQQEAMAANEAVEKLSENCNIQIEKMSNAAKEDLEVLANSTKVLAQTSHEQIEEISEVARDEMRMLSDASAQLATENHNQLEHLTQTTSKQMTMLSNTAGELLQNNQQQVTAAVESVREQADVLIQAANEFAEFTQQQQRILNETVTREMASLKELTSKTSEELDHATEAMQSAAATLDQNLDGALDRTFGVFDKELADITQHLSGTIAQVRDNTEVVPELLMRAQKQYETTLNTLNAQTSQYIGSMKTLNRYIQERLDDMTVAESKAGSKKDETEM